MEKVVDFFDKMLPWAMVMILVANWLILGVLIVGLLTGNNPLGE